MGLEYELIKKGKIIAEGIVGNQFQFFSLASSLSAVKNKENFPTAFKYFPQMNDGLVPADQMKDFVSELEQLGKEPILSWDLIKDNQVLETIVSGQNSSKQIVEGLYQVFDAEGFKIVASRKNHLMNFAKNISDNLLPYKSVGYNFNWMSSIELDDPIVVFHSKGFKWRTFGELVFLEDNNSSQKYLMTFPISNEPLIQHYEVKEQQIPIGESNYIFHGVLGAAKHALELNASIEWC